MGSLARVCQKGFHPFQAAYLACVSRSMWVGVAAHLRYRFVVGLFLLFPLFLTYLILKIVFDFLDGFFAPIFETIFDRKVPGVGIVALVVVMYLSGVVVASLVGRRAFLGLEGLLLRVPAVRQVYAASRMLVTSLSGNASTGLSRVVLLEYPRPGLWAVGFLTGLTSDEDGVMMAVVYIPTAPLPNSGWLSVLAAEDVYDTNLTSNEVMQMVFSGGMIFPDRLEKRPLREVAASMPRVSVT